jgi:hypothetical protein
VIFDLPNRRIPLEQFVPAGRGLHPEVLVLRGADGMKVRGDPYRNLARDLAHHEYAAFVVHYLGDSAARFSPSWINPLSFLG